MTRWSQKPSPLLHYLASKLRTALAAAAGLMLALHWPPGPWPLDPWPFGRWSRRTPVTISFGRYRHSSRRRGMVREPPNQPDDPTHDPTFSSYMVLRGCQNKPTTHGKRRHGVSAHQHCRATARELSRRRERSGGLQGSTRRTRAHRLLPRAQSVLSGTIRSRRRQGARSIRRRTVSGNRWNGPCKTSAASSKMMRQIAADRRTCGKVRTQRAGQCS